MRSLKALVSTATRLALVSWVGLSSAACQSINALGLNPSQQESSIAASGTLQFRVQWPAFTTQALAEHTHRLVIGVYQGRFSEQSSQNPRFIILEAGQESAVFEKLAVGQTQVFCVALAEDNALINGDITRASVEANQRKPVVLALKSLPLSGVPTAEAQALEQWVKDLFPTPAPALTPAPMPPVTQASPTPAPVPTLSPSTSPENSPTPPPGNASPEPTPSPRPETGSRGGSSGGGSSGGGNSEGGELNSEITIDDGAPRPDTVVIQ